MTLEAKIDPALAERMGRETAAALPVLIELVDQPAVPPGTDRRAEMDTLAHQADAVTDGVIAQLHHLGVPDDGIEWFFIVNAVAVSLTPDQIRDIAARPDVRLVRYNGQADVTL